MTGPGRGMILLADDDTALRESCRELLEADGFEVHVVRDGKEALAALDERHFDAILSDIVMPGLTGVGLLRSLRERDLDLPFVLMTGDPTVETATAAVEFGAVRYLTKPVESVQLLAAVSAAVSLGRLAAARRDAFLSGGQNHSFVGDHVALEGAYQGALETLWMAYQPIVRAEGGAVEGMEALLRSDRAPLASAFAFLGAAQRLGKMQDLGRAIRQRVATNFNDGVAGTVYVNLSPRELMDESLYSPEAPLSAFAKRCVIEITEREALDQVPGLSAAIRELKKLGYRVAIDDLGAGYAGLASFAALEPEVVKLDRTLVAGIDEAPVQRRIISSIVSLCRDLKIVVLGEGVETKGERDTLTDLGCDLLQGYYLGRPARRET